MESMITARQWGWVIILVVLLSAVAQAGKWINEESFEMLQLGPDIYSDGPLKAELLSVASDSVFGVGPRNSKKEHTSEVLQAAKTPPRPLLIAVPEETGQYPVIVLQHAYTMKNTFYSQLMKHVATHGFIVVAPQMCIFSGSDATDEICTAAAVIDWLPEGLAEVLSKRSTAKPALEKLALVGHSRGGKVAFGLAKGVCPTTLKFSAIAGLDPVDGRGIGQQTEPPILEFSQFSFNLGMPTLIVGARLGAMKKNILFPPCAPEGVSHDAFFFESSRPSYHFVAADYGHMDYLDDETDGIQGWISYATCKNGWTREPMRRFAGGILVAFLRASMLNDGAALAEALTDPSLAPVKLLEPESFGTLSLVR